MFIRRLPKFNYHTPATISEALDLLSAHGRDAKLLAGGTDLLLAMKKRASVPSHLINLKTIPGLSGIRADAKGITIGALTTIAEIERSALVQETYSPLGDAARVMASPQIRTLATVGVTWSVQFPPPMAPPPHGARPTITGLSGEEPARWSPSFVLPLCAWSHGHCDHITIPARREGRHLKLMPGASTWLCGRRAYVSLDANRVCNDVRMFRAVADPDQSCRRRGAQGETLTEGLAAEAGKVSGAGETITDIRATQGYRRSMVEVPKGPAPDSGSTQEEPRASARASLGKSSS
jgi:carbon-monoxide dehydrogenase medium subunit